MQASQIILLVIIGLLGGILSGSLGVGGGIIIIPALVIFFGLSQHQAQGAFIGMVVFPVQILAAYSYYKHENLNWRYSLIMLATFTIGSYLGAKISNLYIPESLLKKIFGILLLFTAIRMIFFK